MAGIYMAKVSAGRGQLFQVTLAPKTARVLTGVSQSRGDLHLMKALYVHMAKQFPMPASEST